MKLKVMLLVLLAFLLSFCATRNPETGTGQEEPSVEVSRNQDPYVAAILPNIAGSGENPREMTDAEIESEFRSLVTKVTPTEGTRGMTVRSFRTHISRAIAEDKGAQEIVAKLLKNGVYISVEKPVSEDSRYGGNDHEELTNNQVLPMLQTLLEKSGDWLSFKENLKDIPFGDKKVSFAKMVQLEDDIDPIFFPFRDFKVGFFVDATTGKIDVGLDAIIISGEVTAKDGVGGEVGYTETISGDTAKQLLDGFITLAHFWDPDKGWNAGNSKVWENLPSLLEKVTFKPEYIKEWLQRPPSSYFKALSYWYGWKKLKWVQRQDENRYCKAKVKVLGYTVYSKTFKCGKKYSDVKELQTETYHGLVDHIKDGDREMAMQYLARVVHLLQDMTVPTHVHNEPHGGVKNVASLFTLDLGGTDMWEQIILKKHKFAQNVYPFNSYKFEVESGQIKEGTLIYYTSKTPNINVEKAIPGSFYNRVQEYYDALAGTHSLFSLFFNAAQAGQYFPVIKQEVEKNANGYYKVAGNQATSYPYHTSLGQFLLGNTSGFDHSEEYNETTKYDHFDVNEALAGPDSLPYREKGTYYLVYEGAEELNDAEEAKLEAFRDVNQVKNMIEVNSSTGRVKVPSGYKLYYLGYPYNKMAETLIPLSVAATSRLMRNYYRFYHQ